MVLSKADDGVAPASRSMFQSSLYHKDDFSLPQIRALNIVQSALQNDAVSQSLKYDAAPPNGGSARFCVDLPRSPQHLKYCHSSRSAPCESSPSCSKSTAEHPGLPAAAQPLPLLSTKATKPRCIDELATSKSKLRALFTEIDKRGTGFVTHRGTMFTLHQRFQELLSDSEQVREATNWLREVAKEVDADNSGCMDWKTFLEFCRRGGILLEYQWQKDIESAVVGANGAMMGQLMDHQAELKNINSADVTDAHLKMQSEIRTRIGAESEARFNKNRRAASPELADQSADDPLS